jgi:hypothetical protein
MPEDLFIAHTGADGNYQTSDLRMKTRCETIPPTLASVGLPGRFAGVRPIHRMRPPRVTG